MKKRFLAFSLFALPVVSALAEGSTYTVPQEITTAIGDVGTMSTELAKTAAPAVMNVAGPWLAIGVIFFVIAIAWSFIRGRRK